MPDSRTAEPIPSATDAPAAPHDGRAAMIRSLIGRIAEDEQHTVLFHADGREQVRSHARVHRDILSTVAAIDRALAGGTARLAAGAAAVVVGPPSYGWVLAAFACFYRGVRVIALPETLTDAEARASLGGIGHDLVLADPACADLPVFAGTPTVAFDLLAGAADADDPRLAAAASPLTPAVSMIAFTSGSTAGQRLKAFELHPDGTEHFARSFTRAFGLVEGDRWLVCSPFSHIVHFEYVVACLLLGLDLQIVKPIDLVLNAARLKPSAIVTVPAVYEQVAGLIAGRLEATPGGRRRLALARRIPEDWLASETVRRFCRRLFPEVRRATGGGLKVMIIGAAPSSRALKKQLITLGLPVYEGYGMSEVGMITCNVPGDGVFGSIGRPFDGIEVRIDDQGILLCKPAFRRTAGYLNVPAEESARTFRPDGWIDTGDIVERLRGGHYVIRGRQKNILVTDRGKKINPRHIEDMLEESGAIAHAVLIGDRRPFLVAILKPAPGAGEAAVDAAVEAVNARVADYERIRNRVIADAPFTVENGLMTRSGKLRRQAVVDHYRAATDALYAQPEAAS